MTPKDGDVVVKGKKGLDAFPGTTLEEELKARGIETVALAGFLTNCCVESTMRTAFEKGCRAGARRLHYCSLLLICRTMLAAGTTP